MLLKEKFPKELVEDDICYKIKRVYDEENKLALVHVLNSYNKTYKVLFYENGERLSNMSIYNPETGKEIRNITYRQDGKTISSVREYDTETARLLCTTFYKPDGKGVSSIIECNEAGTQTQFTIFADNGEVITQSL